jgi:hypothetical protein
LTLGMQLAAFLQKYRSASAWVPAQHFLMSMPTIEEILQRESWGWKILAVLGASFSVPRPKCCSYWSTNKDATNSTRVRRIMLKESQYVTSAGSNISIRPQKSLHDRRQTSFQVCTRPSGRRKLW